MLVSRQTQVESTECAILSHVYPATHAKSDTISSVSGHAMVGDSAPSQKADAYLAAAELQAGVGVDTKRAIDSAAGRTIVRLTGIAYRFRMARVGKDC